MRKITFLAIMIIACQFAFSQQTTQIVPYYNWSNPATFQLSPSPIITGHGYYSDSLANTFEGKTFYEYNNDYYCIESWADYYYWFTHKYWYMFSDPHLYQYYYWTKDDLRMATYIAGHNYLGNYYPSLITLNFGNLSIENNRLKNRAYVPRSEKEEKRFLRQLNTKKTVQQNHVAINYKSSTQVVNKEKTKKYNSNYKTINRQTINREPVKTNASISSNKPAGSKGKIKK